jgi:prepilin-type N-terminal cleavage/methylation domain-containing protein
MQSVVIVRSRQRKNFIAAFTLVELLVVIAIIGILAAITLGAATTVMSSAARSRAKTEMEQMKAGLEAYKNDNGAYPLVNTMDTNTYSTYDGSGTATNYTYSAQVLYQALTGQTNFLDTPLAGVTHYMTFKAGHLGNATAPAGTSATGGSSTYIADPWGYAYGYNTGSTNAYPYSGNGFYDLWTTGGSLYGSTTFTNTWISNWSN